MRYKIDIILSAIVLIAFVVFFNKFNFLQNINTIENSKNSELNKFMQNNLKYSHNNELFSKKIYLTSSTPKYSLAKQKELQIIKNILNLYNNNDNSTISESEFANLFILKNNELLNKLDIEKSKIKIKSGINILKKYTKKSKKEILKSLKKNLSKYNDINKILLETSKDLSKNNKNSKKIQDKIKTYMLYIDNIKNSQELDSITHKKSSENSNITQENESNNNENSTNNGNSQNNNQQNNDRDNNNSSSSSSQKNDETKYDNGNNSDNQNNNENNYQDSNNTTPPNNHDNNTTLPDNNQTNDENNTLPPDDNQTNEDNNTLPPENNTTTPPDNNQTNDENNTLPPDNNQTNENNNTTPPDNNQTNDNNSSNGNLVMEDLNGAVINKSYVQDALVCIDSNQNSVCDNNEYFTRSDFFGQYHFRVPKKLLDSNPQIIATGGYDRGKKSTLKLKIYASQKNLTIITTLSKYIINQTNKSSSWVKDFLFNALNISKKSVFNDYINESINGNNLPLKASLKLISCSKIIATYNDNLSTNGALRVVANKMSDRKTLNEVIETFNDNIKFKLRNIVQFIDRENSNSYNDLIYKINSRVKYLLHNNIQPKKDKKEKDIEYKLFKLIARNY